jgi:cytosine/adenosine deaminase-related metal-dependent hydrolase
MLISNVIPVGSNTNIQIKIQNGLIKALNQSQNILADDGTDIHLKFDNAIVFPGLINSHEHLDFNLFSPYGHNKYNNYVEWANYIHTTHKNEINTVLSIPEHLRTLWGIYKNLLCGITTVINHGKYLPITNNIINVIQPNQNLHSVQFEKKWKLKLNHPLKNKEAYCIHIGEGIDGWAQNEIDKLIHWNFLHKELIGIHAVAMKPLQAKRFKAIVWCPSSNYFLFNSTADITRLKLLTKIIFGTDSTLTADWNIWNHLRLGRTTNMLTDTELFHSVTSTPASVWKKNTGNIVIEKEADLVIANNSKNTIFNSFYNTNPENILLITIKGAIKLFDETQKEQIVPYNLDLKNFSRIKIANTVKYVYGNLAELTNIIHQYHPSVRFPFEII